MQSWAYAKVLFNKHFCQKRCCIWKVVSNSLRWAHYYMAVSLKDWELPNSRNLIGWNRYWKWSRLSHLDWHLDRFHFVVKKLQFKMQKYWLFSPNNIYLLRCQKAWWEKKCRGQANFIRIKFGSSRFASKMSASAN